MATTKIGEPRAQVAIKYLPARENPMFPAEMTACMRFVRSKQKIACAHCGKVSKKNWTMVIPFKATDFGFTTLVESPLLLAPLTPVCDEHPLAPDKTMMEEIGYSFRLWYELKLKEHKEASTHGA